MDAGNIIGRRYRIVRKLGEGGMGVVYHAEHVVTGRGYAVKLLENRASLPAESVDRFLREARAPAQIRHPNIVDVTDADTEPDGTPYIVMELLEGETLDCRIGHGKVVQAQEMSSVFRQLLDALDAMHAAGVVHRDLKPANIFLCGKPGEGTLVKVLDFGIAKALGEESRTQSGYVMGTPAYMSPEQMRNARSATPRSDLWSVGVMLYEALVGHRPFRGETFALLAMISGPDAHVSLRTLTPELPRAITDLVNDLLEKDPTRRPSSAALVRDRLVAALAQCPTIRAVPAPDGAIPDVRDRRAAGSLEASVSQLPSDSSPLSDSASVSVASGRRARTGWIVALALLLVAIGGFATWRVTRPVLHGPPARTDLARVDSGDGRAVADDPTLAAFLNRWLGTVAGTQGRAPLGAFYAEATRFRASGGLAPITGIQRYWTDLFDKGGTFGIDWGRSRYGIEPADLSAGTSPACVNLAGASGPVIKVRAWATEQVYERSPDIGCPRLEGVYLLRVRRVPGGFRICHETWSLREGVCASCPTARVCADAGTGGRS